MIAGLLGRKRTVQVPCTIEVERTRETLHAHVSLDGLEVNEGDEVTVLRAPSQVAFGERLELASMATVVRATQAERWWTRLVSYRELTELYEVGFQPKE
jgi:hypothetical protein